MCEIKTIVKIALSCLTKGTIFVGAVICLISIGVIVYYGLIKRSLLEEEIRGCVMASILGMHISIFGLILDLMV